MELVETSFDFNLSDSQLRLVFPNNRVVGDVGIFESDGKVYVLVATLTRTYIFTFPHPNRLQQYVSDASIHCDVWTVYDLVSLADFFTGSRLPSQPRLHHPIHLLQLQQHEPRATLSRVQRVASRTRSRDEGEQLPRQQRRDDLRAGHVWREHACGAHASRTFCK